MERTVFMYFIKGIHIKFFNVLCVDNSALLWKVKTQRKSGEKCEWKEEKRCKIR